MQQDEEDARIRREKILWVFKVLACIAFIAVMMIPVYAFKEQSKIRQGISAHIDKIMGAVSEAAEELSSVDHHGENDPDVYYHGSSDDSSE